MVVVYRKVIAVRTVVGVSVTVAVVVSARAVGATVAKKHPTLEKKSLQTK